MKPIAKLIHVCGRTSGLARRLIDFSVTKEVFSFCQGISRLTATQLSARLDVQREKALLIRQCQLVQREKIANTIRNFKSTIHETDQKELRRNHRHIPELFYRLIRDVLWISGGVYSHGNIVPNMRFNELITRGYFGSVWWCECPALSVEDRAARL